MPSEHSIASAMARGELNEDEAFFILRFAGRVGYDAAIKRLSDRGLLHRARRWAVRISGWEWPQLSQWDDGKPAWEPKNGRGEWKDPTPITLFDRVTFFGPSFAGTNEERHWGQVRIGGGYLVWRWTSWAYWSPDATPSHERAFDIAGNKVERNRRRR